MAASRDTMAFALAILREPTAIVLVATTGMAMGMEATKTTTASYGSMARVWTENDSYPTNAERKIRGKGVTKHHHHHDHHHHHERKTCNTSANLDPRDNETPIRTAINTTAMATMVIAIPNRTFCKWPEFCTEATREADLPKKEFYSERERHWEMSQKKKERTQKMCNA